MLPMCTTAAYSYKFGGGTMTYRYILLGSILIASSTGIAGRPGGLARPVSGNLSLLGSVPHTCPSGPAPKILSPVFAAGYGAYPVWGVGFVGQHATLAFGTDFAQLKSEYDTTYGWGHKLLWVMPPGYKGRVTLRGGELRSGLPLWFDGRSGKARTLVLDPQRVLLPSSPKGTWATFAAALYVPKAGCYYLNARWPGGQWRMTFAAGTH